MKTKKVDLSNYGRSAYTKAELSMKAKELNFVRDTLEKVVRLTEIFDYMQDHSKENE